MHSGLEKKKLKGKKSVSGVLLTAALTGFGMRIGSLILQPLYLFKELYPLQLLLKDSLLVIHSSPCIYNLSLLTGSSSRFSSC